MNRAPLCSMKPPRLLSIALAAWLLPAALLSGAGDDPAAALLTQRLDVLKQQNRIQAEQNQVGAALQAKLGGIYSTLTMLKRPPASDEEIRQMKANVESLKAQLETLQQQVEVAGIKDPAGRADAAKKLEAEGQAIARQLQDASKPGQEKIRALMAPLQKSDPEFARSLEKFVKKGTGKYAGAVPGKVTWNETAGQVAWLDAKGNQLAWASFFLQTEPAPVPGEKKVTDRAALLNAFNNNIWVSANHFKVALSTDNKNWQGDEATLIGLAQNLIDLDGLASVGTEPK